MMVSTKGSTLRLLRWQKKYALLFVANATAVVVAHELSARPQWFELPSLPLSVVGAALGIFVSFRTQASYARWWEGRQLWGKLVNVSRHFASQTSAYLRKEPAAAEQIRALVLRHALYVHTLRCQLRKQSPTGDEHIQRLQKLVPAALDGSNPNHQLLHTQLEVLTELYQKGLLDSVDMQSFDNSIRVMLDVQGGCERIKNTPMPQGYGFMASRLIAYYSVMFPFALVTDLHWFTIPLNLVVCLSFALISEAGRVLEDPFTTFYNGLPLSQLSTMIEVNIRERLGDTDLPEIPTVDETGILM